MADDGAEDDEDGDEDERIRWYEGDGVEDEGEEGGDANDSDICNEGGDSEGLCTDRPSINTNSTSEGLGSLHPPYGSIITNCILCTNQCQSIPMVIPKYLFCIVNGTI